jgi:hypothetical protein
MPLPATHAEETATALAPAGVQETSDPGATVSAAPVPSSSPGSTSRPRKNTLAAAIRPRHGDERQSDERQSDERQSDEHAALPAYHPDSDELPGDFASDLRGDAGDGILDETDADDEWALADQPTVMLGGQTPDAEKPNLPLAAERTNWPALKDAAQQTPGPRQPKTTRPVHPDVLGGLRLASPDGAVMPVTPPKGTPRMPAANPRVERFQELRGKRKAHEHGERAPQDPQPVKEVVRTLWGDLRPGLARALHVQHEARESGAYPIPAYVATAVSRLGDVFGKVATSTRDLAMHAHHTAAPALRRWHDQAEVVAQRLIDKLDGGAVQQQAPFLGPGRIAVLFRSGVGVGQAQRLLETARAKPMRVIPRKHGFLALVPRGLEAQVAERLRQHPYVRDVIYMEYDDPSQSLSAEVPAIMGLQR